MLIEKNTQAALQSKLKLLHRQLEVSSKGEQTWEIRAAELQKQLEVEQGELTKVKDERESMKAEISELHKDVDSLKKKLQEQVGLHAFSLMVVKT